MIRNCGLLTFLAVLSVFDVRSVDYRCFSRYRKSQFDLNTDKVQEN